MEHSCSACTINVGKEKPSGCGWKELDFTRERSPANVGNFSISLELSDKVSIM